MLEQAGIPRNKGPIIMKSMEHEHSKEITKHMEDSAKEYIDSGNSTNLIYQI